MKKTTSNIIMSSIVSLIAAFIYDLVAYEIAIFTMLSTTFLNVSDILNEMENKK